MSIMACYPFHTNVIFQFLTAKSGSNSHFTVVVVVVLVVVVVVVVVVVEDLVRNLTFRQSASSFTSRVKESERSRKVQD